MNQGINEVKIDVKKVTILSCTVNVILWTKKEYVSKN